MPSVPELLRQAVPVPRIEACRRVLCVQPHADDTDVAAGATIAKLTRSGAEVVYLTVTDGSAGTTDPGLTAATLSAIRQREQEAAARVLGVRELRWLGMPDAGDYPEHAVRIAVVRAIRELRPDLVITVDPFLPYESHPDHLLCGRATAAAVLLYGFPNVRTAPGVDEGFRPHALRGIAYYHTAAPNQFVAVGDEEWRLKFEAIACHESQVDPATMDTYRAYFELKARECGAAAGVERAEAFKVLPPQMMHCAVDAGKM